MSTDPGDALHLDAAAVRDVLLDLVVKQSKEVVLVMHSYGGLAGTEGYAMFCEDARTISGKVIRLVYLAAHGAVEKGTVFLPAGVQLPHLQFDVCNPRVLVCPRTPPLTLP